MALIQSTLCNFVVHYPPVRRKYPDLPGPRMLHPSSPPSSPLSALSMPPLSPLTAPCTPAADLERRAAFRDRCPDSPYPPSLLQSRRILLSYATTDSDSDTTQPGYMPANKPPCLLPLPEGFPVRGESDNFEYCTDSDNDAMCYMDSDDYFADSADDTHDESEAYWPYTLRYPPEVIDLTGTTEDEEEEEEDEEDY